MTSIVETLRGGIVESRHRVSVAAVDADGKLVAWTGDPDLLTYWRSCAKLVQVLPLLTDGAAAALGITDAEVAVACASHNGEPRHVEVVTGLLKKAQCTEDDLACGPHSSLAPAVARAMAERGERPRRIHSNCSGKHAGMLALARFHGWPTADYRLPSHPVQRRLLTEVARWTGVPEPQVGQGVDGCGVVSYALPLQEHGDGVCKAGIACRTGCWWVVGGRWWCFHNPQPTTHNPLVRRRGPRRPLHHRGSIPRRRHRPPVHRGDCRFRWPRARQDRRRRRLLRRDSRGAAGHGAQGGGRRRGQRAARAARPCSTCCCPGAVHVAESFRSPVIKNTLGEEVGGISARISLERPA